MLPVLRSSVALCRMVAASSAHSGLVGVRALHDNGLGDMTVEPLPRHNEDETTLRQRLVYQSRKRGNLENCLLLSTFAAAHLNNMTVDQLQRYDKLLDENDWDLFYWITGAKPVPDKHNNDVLKMLKSYCKNERKESLSMPPL